MGKWPLVRLGDVATVVTGSTPKTSVEEYWNGDNCWVTPAELTDELIVVNDSARKITDLGVKHTGLKPMPIGTVLLSSRAPIGKVAISGCVMYCNQGFKNLVCGESIYNKYLFWFLKGKTKYLNSLGRGATFKEISKTIVEDIKIPLPAINVQKHIADTLDKTQEIIDGHKKQLAELDNLIKAVFYEMFGDPVINEKGWKMTNIQSACIEIVDCPHSTPKHSTEITNYPAIRTTEIRKGYIDWNSMKYVDEKEYKKRTKRIVPRANDIVYGREGSYGDAVILPEGYSFCLGQRVMLLRVNNTKFNHKYFWCLLRSDFVYNQAKQKNIGATVGHINVADIKQFIIPIPPIYLQNKFDEIVTKIEEQKAIVKQAIAESEHLFNSLMSEYFD